jgi:hypothetical protein
MRSVFLVCILNDSNNNKYIRNFIFKDVAFPRKSALRLKLRTLIAMYAKFIPISEWKHLLYFLLQGITLILKWSRYFICSESIKKMSNFAWYLVLFSFLRDQCRFPYKFRQAPFRIKKLNILPLVDCSFFGFTADFVMKKGTFGNFTGLDVG